MMLIMTLRIIQFTTTVQVYSLLSIIQYTPISTAQKEHIISRFILPRALKRMQEARQLFTGVNLCRTIGCSFMAQPEHWTLIIC